MRQIFWFLVGFCLAFVPVYLVYADDCEYDITDPAVAAPLISSLNPTYFETYSSSSDAYNACVAESRSCNAYPVRTTVAAGVSLSYYYGGTSGNLKYYCYNVVGDICEPSQDADGDGVSDWADLLTTDIDDYEGAIKEVCYDADGNVVYGRVVGKDGQVWEFGEMPSDLTDYDYYTFSNDQLQYKTNTELESWWSDKGFGQDNLNLTPLSTQYLPGDPDGLWGQAQTDKKISDQKGDATEKNDTKMKDTETKTGTETDSQALGKIITNTQATADNIKRLGDYLNEINSSLKDAKTSVQSIDNNYHTTIIGADTSGDDGGGDDEPVEDLSSAATAINNAATATDSSSAVAALESAYNDPADMDDVPETHKNAENVGIAKNWWDISLMIAEVVATNPITDALLGIEVEAEGNCSFAYTWQKPSGGSADIEFSVCHFEDTLNVFGQVLLMLASFHAIVILFRRN